MNIRLETKLNIKDLRQLQEAFMADGDGYNNKLSLNKAQFSKALLLILQRGTAQEYEELFDKVDLTKEGVVDWDKLASHLFLEFCERDDRAKSTLVPQWKDLKILPSPHKEVIQKITIHNNRYISLSKEGNLAMWSSDLKLQRSIRAVTDACRTRDLWVTNFVTLPNVNKMAISFTSKEIVIYDLSSKLEFNCQYKIQGLHSTPLYLDYWYNPDDVNEAILAWADTGGFLNALHFTSANIALFERPPAPAAEKQDTCLIVRLKDIIKKKYKNAIYHSHHGHKEWVRQVKFIPNLECFISCSTTSSSSLVIGWLEKHNHNAESMKTSSFNITQGVNAFDYHVSLNLIATAGVNHQVCLWNPYVVSKPNGVLRGHMASVVQVQFNKTRGNLLSFSRDKVLRIWDVQLQVCIQRLAGIFPRGPEANTVLVFDERAGRLLITFNYQLAMVEMKPEVRGRVLTHDKPVLTAIYNSTYKQVVTACQSGLIQLWMVDSGQKVKAFHNGQTNAELTGVYQDFTQTRLLTSCTDGLVKIWDFNGHCYNVLHCGQSGQPADLGQVLTLKHSTIVIGWTKMITVFRNFALKDYHVYPSDWKGGQEHTDDVLAAAFLPPVTLVTGSYDGEIIVWNISSEMTSRRLGQRSRPKPVYHQSTFNSRENTNTSIGVKSNESKSRRASRASQHTADDSNEYEYAITKLFALEVRRSSYPNASQLVSCGGNGWVRFWNIQEATLNGEWQAHEHVASITMTIDQADNQWLVTGDVDGLIKIWNIAEYCISPSHEASINQAPALHRQWQAHQDTVNMLDMCIRNERTLVITGSADCTVCLWDIDGNNVGIFGQEQHWKITAPLPAEEVSDEDDQSMERLVVDYEETKDGEWTPEPAATKQPDSFRLNVWDKSLLGKDYEKLRTQKRERRQPQIIEDLSYLHWERTGQPPAGPYAALETVQLSETNAPRKPDFINNPHRYFMEKDDDSFTGEARPPVLAETLKAAFDEKTLLPRSLLEFETKNKQVISRLQQEQKQIVGKAFQPSSRAPSLASQNNIQTRRNTSKRVAKPRTQQKRPSAKIATASVSAAATVSS